MINLFKLHSNPETLYGYDHIIQIPQMAWAMTDVKQKRKMTDLWLKDPETAVRYATKVMEKRWPEAEPIIAKSAKYAYEYANFFPGRFLEGEPAIATVPTFAYSYARHKIGGRWPEGEAAIATDPDEALNYADKIIKGPWPPGEAAIARDPLIAFYYAEDIIQGRFPLAEPGISRNAVAARYYADRVLHDPNPNTWAKRYRAKHGL